MTIVRASKYDFPGHVVWTVKPVLLLFVQIMGLVWLSPVFVFIRMLLMVVVALLIFMILVSLGMMAMLDSLPVRQG